MIQPLHKRNFALHLQERNGHDQPVLLKEPALETPSAYQIEQLHNEYRISMHLTGVAGVRTIFGREGMESYPVLLLDYIAGNTLADIIAGGAIDLERKLSIAVEIAEILDRIHKRRVIHKDINSSNILISIDGSVHLIDFGIAAFVSPEGSIAVTTDENLVGNLAYISPEQTGRLNRPVDHRTDLYSLGVVLYELLTGQLPFQSGDTLKMIHDHIARNPKPPADLTRDVPLPVSNIILRLMSKEAEARYQTTQGLSADLQRCLKEYQDSGRIEDFELGREDFSNRLQIPANLYGRENERTQLLETFERAAAGEAELLLVAGYAGVGKTSLVHEVQRPITEKGGYFTEGKFDQYQRGIPYSAWGQAFTSLINLWLSESEASLAVWKTIILDAVGENGRVLSDLIPNLERIIGPQPKVPKLGGKETKNRFNYIFQRFIGAVARPGQPLVIFLDDLQWIDLASLRLFDILLNDPECRHLLVIGAYRVNQVDDTHPLILELSHLKEANRSYNQLAPKNLALEHVNRLLSDTLRMPPDHCLPLARLVYAKTDGNAFFTRQFLHTIAGDGLLSFDSQKGQWCWDMTRLNKLAMADNIVDLMVKRIRHLPAASREVLQVAACLGVQFEPALLGRVLEKSREEIWKTLQASLEQGFVVQVDGCVEFTHDRIQQAAYSLIPKQEVPSLHWHIGQILLTETPAEAQDEHLFEIVGHLNMGTAHIERVVERHTLVELNKKASESAQRASAHAAALEYAQMGIDLLGDDWQSHYQMILRLHLLAAEASHLNADYRLCEQHVETIITSARSEVDRALGHMIRIESLNVQHQLQAAIETGLEALRELGVPLQSARPSDVSCEVLSDLPVMNDQRGLAATSILAACIHPAYVGRSELLPVFTRTILHQTITHGITSAGCLAIESYAASDIWHEDVEKAYHLGRLGLRLNEQLDDKRYYYQVGTAFDSFLLHWQEHFSKVKAAVERNIQRGFEVGSRSYLGTNLITDTVLNVLVGNPLAHAQEAMERNLRRLEKVRERYRSYDAFLWTQLVANLRGMAEDPTQFAGPFFLEETDLPEVKADGIHNTVFLFHVLKSYIHYHLGDYHAAYAHAEQAEPRAPIAASSINVHLLPFYQSLALLRIPEGQLQHVEKLEANIDKLRIWAKHAPMNFQHKLGMVLAERERVVGDIGLAIVHYEQAINGAIQNGFLQDEALANELFGRFWHERGNDKIARIYLSEAYALYRRWGAYAIAEYLEEQYPQWLRVELIESPVDDLAPLQTTLVRQEQLDLFSILKASQTIARELDTENLLAKMMTVVMENAGAQRAFLIVERDGQWIVRAEGEAETGEVRVLKGIDIVEVDEISSGIVYYVVRTRQSVLLDDAAFAGRFVQDPVIQRRLVKSLLCMPLLNRGQLSGVLYLENNLINHTFTSERVDLLELLSSQMAVSIDHAQLHDRLEDKVTERTRALSFAEEQIRTLFATSRIGIGLTTIEGKVLAANNSLLRMLGYTEEEMLLRNVTEFYSAPERRFELLERLSVSKSVNDFGVRLKRKDDTTLLANMNVSKIVRDGQEVLMTMIEDVTERIRAEEQLRFQGRLLETVGQSVIVTDLEGHVVYWNPAAERLFGWTAEEAVGRLTSELMVDAYDQEPIPEVRAHFLAGKSWTGEFPVYHRDGTPLNIETTITPVFNENGELSHTIGVSQDVSERKQAREALQKSEEAYRGLVEKINDVIYAIDLDGVITYLNPAVESLIGLPPEQVIGQPFAQYIHPEDLGKMQDSVQSLFSGEAPGPAEYRVMDTSGEIRWIRVTSQPVTDGDRVTGLQGVLSDISERKKLDERREEEATLAERARLARMLHDAVTQTLFSASVIAEATPRVWLKDPTQAHRNMDQLTAMLRGAMAEMRSMIIELSPSATSGKTLGELLQTLVEANQPRTNYPVSLVVEGDNILPEAVTIGFYRVAQEALHNVVQHAEATEAGIKVVIDQEGAFLSIHDNGRGFDQNASPAGHFGLSIMRERLREIGGNLVIESQPGAGTQVIASWSDESNGEES